MAEVKINRKRQEQDDFFKSYQQGADIKAKQELLKIKQQEMQMDFVQQIMKQKAESQKLNIDMMKAGINPGRAGQTRVGSFDPFTGKQVPGGVMHDPGTQGNVFQGTVGMGGGTSVHRKPQAQKTLSPRDLSDLSFAMGDESVKPFVMQVLKERGVDPSVLKQFEQQAAAQTQVEPTQSTGKAGKSGRPEADAQGRTHLMSRIQILRQLPIGVPFSRVAQEISNDSNLKPDEKLALLRIARRRFRDGVS